MLRPRVKPLSAQSMKIRKFLILHCLPLTDEKLVDVKDVTGAARLIYTLIRADHFSPTVIREFIANLLDAKERADGGRCVFHKLLSGVLSESESLTSRTMLIGALKKIDPVCAYLTDDHVKSWVKSKFLTLTNQVLYKLVCSNWIPTISYTAMNQERLKFL
ncbi:hypothetical protein F2Q68_00030766 [Brassica cretica]|uniref:Uncharacterized protein n=2 Tax=Brassica cretica TaxID=69181 RepID=A0A3N6RKX2_BRACR|nr:hypothetical protein F2Q68_00030766 [Brassica cretica]KAF3529332.1 hypothetical protein DY000_02039319 [Brassica cretica]